MDNNNLNLNNENTVQPAVQPVEPVQTTAPVQPVAQAQPVAPVPPAAQAQPVYVQQPMYVQQPVYYAQAPVSNEAPEHGKAVASMVLGILSITGFGLIVAIIGLVLGNNARKAGNNESICTAGRVLSIIGLVIGIIRTIIVVFYLMFIFVLMMPESGSTALGSINDYAAILPFIF